MVALLHPSPVSHPPRRTASRPAPASSRRTPGRPNVPTLHLIEGGQSERLSRQATIGRVSPGPFSMLGVVGVMAAVLLVVVVRGVQGAPPAEDWASLTAPSAEVSSASAAELVPPSGAVATLTVLADDTWASIAARVAPESDPVEVARWLATQNSGYQLQAGQVLDISPLP